MNAGHRRHLPGRRDRRADVGRGRGRGHRPGNPETGDNVFAALAGPVLGDGLAWLLFLAVLASSASSLQTTFLPPARTLLAMATYRALPARFARVHPRFKTPSYATLSAGIATAAFYTVMVFLSENVLIDTIYALGLIICFYYGLTAYACVWYFRGELRRKTAVDTVVPAYGSGSSVSGIGSVFAIGVGLLALGLLVMVAWRSRHPEFFRGETLHRHTPRPGVRAGARRAGGRGCVTGVTETATGIGGPPLALVYQHRPAPQLRSTVAVCFVIGEVVSLALLGATGKVDGHQLWTALLPALGIGALLSAPCTTAPTAR